MIDEITTDRLRLRRWRSDDRIAFREMNADPAVMEFFRAPLTAGESDGFADRIMAEFDEKGWGLWGVEPRAGEPEAGRFVGFIGFHEAVFESDFTPCPEIGWRLCRSAWGRGYATEGARACLDDGFSRLGFEKVISFAPVVNRRSLAVMEKIGLRKLREFPHPDVPVDHGCSVHALYGRNREDYFS